MGSDCYRCATVPDFRRISPRSQLISYISIAILRVKCSKLKMWQILKISSRQLIIALLSACCALVSACTHDFADTEKTYWTPEVGDLLQIQYADEPLDLSVEAYVFSIDLFESSQEAINKLHGQGKHVICYINTGAWEEYRPDADAFPESVIGRDYEGWPGEKWLDIRHFERFEDIMLARFDLAEKKDCDGIDADNMQNFEEETGFTISANDQLAYNIWLSEQAHQRGLSIGLKNNPQQVDDLLEYFDWSLIEDCHFYDWCDMQQPFINSNKPVFQVEYTDNFGSIDDFCSHSSRLGYSGMLKNRDLDAWVQYCP